METVNQFIEAIETFIRINGDRFKLYYLKYGMRGEGLPFRKIEEIVNDHGSLSEYIAQFIETYNPQSIEVVTKKPNGNSHGIHPKSRIFSLESIEQTNNLQPVQTPINPMPTAGLAGIEKIHSLETTLLNRELQKETNRAERFEGLYNTLREKHYELDKDFKLMKDKTDLEREKERLQNENSLSAVIKEIKPELFGLLGNMAESNQPLSTTLQGVGNDKVKVLTDTLSQLPEAMQNEAIQVLIRYLNLEATDRGEALAAMQSKTEHLNDQITEILNT